MLTIFYDAQCPLCQREMDKLARYDQARQLYLEDINAEGFTARYPQIDPKEANRILHAQTETGELLLGLDATWAAWKTVGHHRWIRLLRWPVIRWFADHAYLWFARNRMQVSRWILGPQACDTARCSIPNKRRRKP